MLRAKAEGVCLPRGRFWIRLEQAELLEGMTCNKHLSQSPYRPLDRGHGTEFFDRKTILDDGIGCSDQKTHSRFLELARSGDRAATMWFIMIAIASGECIALEKGQIVFVEDLSAWHGTR